MGMVASLDRCLHITDWSSDMHHLEFRRFTCPHTGGVNGVASLLVTTSEAAMRLLISREGVALNVTQLLTAFAAYTSLNICLSGIPVPTGNFTGTMLIGGIVGHALGLVVRDHFPVEDGAKPGVYALMGS